MNRAKVYAQAVISGEIKACKQTIQACKRFESDLQLWQFDQELCDHAVNFIEELQHTTGEYAGRNFKLEEWQYFIVANLFGFVNADGTRRFTRAYVEVPRKNGKSTFSSALMLYGLLADGEAAAQVYSAATKLDQAMMVFGESCRVCQNTDWLQGEVVVNNSVNNRRILYGQNLYKPLEWNPNKQDGLNTHFACIDEYHAHPSDELYNVVYNSMGARRQPLLFTITTAGFNRESPCYRHRQYCSNVLFGAIKDEALFTIIYTLDEGDDWTDELNWAKANPNWNVSVYPRQLRTALTEAKERTSKEVEFKTKLLNVWTDTAMTWISDSAWAECNVGAVNLDGSTCYGGLDLASTSDFCAFSLWFPDENMVKTWYFLPESAVKNRTDSTGEAYKQWVNDEYIIVTDGNVTDYDFIRAKINTLCTQYRVKEIAYDRFNSSQLVTQLESDGVIMYPFGQGFVSMNAPTKELERRVKSKELRHDGNPVTRWMMRNIMIKTDPAGNIKIDKAKSGDKVDGPVSIVMALGTWLTPSEKSSDFYVVNL